MLDPGCRYRSLPHVTDLKTASYSGALEQNPLQMKPLNFHFSLPHRKQQGSSDNSGTSRFAQWSFQHIGSRAEARLGDGS